MPKETRSWPPSSGGWPIPDCQQHAALYNLRETINAHELKVQKVSEKGKKNKRKKENGKKKGKKEMKKGNKK